MAKEIWIIFLDGSLSFSNSNAMKWHGKSEHNISEIMVSPFVIKAHPTLQTSNIEHDRKKYVEKIVGSLLM